MKKKKGYTAAYNEMAKYAACSNKSFHSFHPSVFKYRSDSADAVHVQYFLASRILEVTKISGNQFFTPSRSAGVEQIQTISEE